mmetsp:Transcript_64525/g.74109  ORF Transcript_64525/g.74109 Transcript_64525/m.74109 type:complete len:326 (+) Transcript_64525:35-1012(+)
MGFIDTLQLSLGRSTKFMLAGLVASGIMVYFTRRSSIHKTIFKLIQSQWEKCASIQLLDTLQSFHDQKDLMFLVKEARGVSKKPMNIGPSAKPNIDPFMPPFETGMHIYDFGSTHRLLFNKFPMTKFHLLVVTQQFERQDEQLNQKDFEYTLTAMRSLQGYTFFNSGLEAGASQKHKHLQVLPREIGVSPPVLSHLEELAEEQPETIFTLPQYDFLHLIKSFCANLDSYSDAEGGKLIHNCYQELAAKLQIFERDLRYNMIVGKNFMLMVPRSKSHAYDHIDLNGMGFLGSFFLKNPEAVEIFNEVGPLNLLKEVAFPTNYLQSA